MRMTMRNTKQSKRWLKKHCCTKKCILDCTFECFLLNNKDVFENIKIKYKL